LATYAPQDRRDGNRKGGKRTTRGGKRSRTIEGPIKSPPIKGGRGRDTLKARSRTNKDNHKRGNMHPYWPRTDRDTKKKLQSEVLEPKTEMGRGESMKARTSKLAKRTRTGDHKKSTKGKRVQKRDPPYHKTNAGYQGPLADLREMGTNPMTGRKNRRMQKH